jgi:hypothetical protein
MGVVDSVSWAHFFGLPVCIQRNGGSPDKYDLVTKFLQGLVDDFNSHEILMMAHSKYFFSSEIAIDRSLKRPTRNISTLARSR